MSLIINKKGGNEIEKSIGEVDFKAPLEKMDEEFFRDHSGRVYNYLLNALEKPLIEKVLNKTAGNQVQAAKVLGINRNTLRTKIKQLGIKKTIEYK